MKNELLIASAGAGKTTYFVKEAIKCSTTVLITTFTEENEKEIRKKFMELNKGIIPAHVTIRTWFSFLLEHGVKPYQSKLTDKRINGLVLVNQQSALYTKEVDVDKHYFTRDYQIYSDKISKFVVRCNEKSNNYVIERISALFKNIFIDEVQDMAGYDLEIIRLFLMSNSIVKIAGDPRQVTYHTHTERKFSKYANGMIQEFIENECKSIDCHINTETLKGSWRNNQSICDFANRIFPEKPQCKSLQTKITGHDGVFLIKENDIDKYLSEYSPLQLRYDRKTKKFNPNYEVKNYGESKGATFDRVLIYPTQKILDWVLFDKEIDSFETKCKAYVAITRARYSVAIVCKKNTVSDVLPFYK